jgi:hypothetical protein
MSGRVGVSRRFFASSVVGSADMPASEHVPKGASFVTALHAFTQHKLRGDRLGYAWRVDEKAQMEIPLFHYEQVDFFPLFFFFFFFFLLFVFF